MAQNIKIISSKNIPDLINKYTQDYSENKQQDEIQEEMVLDAYRWGEKNNFEIVNIVVFPMNQGINLIIAYK